MLELDDIIKGGLWFLLFNVALMSWFVVCLVFAVLCPCLAPAWILAGFVGGTFIAGTMGMFGEGK